MVVHALQQEFLTVKIAITDRYWRYLRRNSSTSIGKQFGVMGFYDFDI